MNKDPAGSGAAPTGFFFLAPLGYGLLQVVAGWIGIREAFGPRWAFAALAVLLFFRSSLPLTVGAFPCARDVWDWPALAALVFAAPGLLFLLFMIPGRFAAAWEWWRERG